MVQLILTGGVGAEAEAAVAAWRFREPRGKEAKGPGPGHARLRLCPCADAGDLVVLRQHAGGDEVCRPTNAAARLGQTGGWGEEGLLPWD